MEEVTEPGEPLTLGDPCPTCNVRLIESLRKHMRAELERNKRLSDEVKRLQGEVHNRNKRALEGDKSTKAWDALYEAHEKLRIEHDNLKRSVKNHGRGDWCYDNECMMCEGVL